MKKLAISSCFLLAVACNISDDAPSAPQNNNTSANNTTANNTSANNTTPNNPTTNNAVVGPLEVVSVNTTEGEPVPLDFVLEVQFSDTIDLNTLTANDVEVEVGDTNVEFDLAVEGDKAFVELEEPELGQTYSVTFQETVAGLGGAVLGVEFETQFTTVGPLEFVSISPTPNTTGVPTEEFVVIEMSDEIDPASVTDANFTLVADKPLPSGIGPDEPVPFDVEVEGNRLRIISANGRWQEYETGYTLTVVQPFSSVTGIPTIDTPTMNFRTILFDREVPYEIHSEVQGPQRAILVLNGGRLSTGRAPGERQAQWFFRPDTDGVWGLESVFLPEQFLEGGDGSDPSFVTEPPGAGQLFTGQAWRITEDADVPADIAAPLGSPNRYRLANENLGSSWNLTLQNEDEIRMEETARGAREQLWWFRRAEE